MTGDDAVSDESPDDSGLEMEIYIVVRGRAEGGVRSSGRWARVSIAKRMSGCFMMMKSSRGGFPPGGWGVVVVCVWLDDGGGDDIALLPAAKLVVASSHDFFSCQ